LSDRLHLTFDAHGGFTGVSTTNAAGLSGIGVVTGMVYRAVGVTVNPGHFSVVPDTTDIDHLTLTLVDRTRLVGPAGALTLDIRTTFHITKIDGQNAVIFEHTSVSCA
jgi:molybdate-binding protein